MLCLAFIVVIGLPMAANALTPATPPNPTAPSPLEPQIGLPVFPGAEGFGTLTPAGRGGRLIEVTSLADSGPGSLREALAAPSPRIIVFRIGGTIELEDFLYINHPYVTVAGQTAPGGGITLRGAGLVITTHDVLVQGLRIRPGDEGPIAPEGNDAVQILGRHGEVEGAHHVVLDHLSLSWSEDELVNTWYGAREITLSWSVLSEPLNHSRHRKGTHSAGLLIGDGSDHVSIHHNVFAHNDFRNPLIISGGTHEFTNNVVYDWGVLPSEIVDDDSNSFLNFVANRYLPGPSTDPLPFEILLNQGDRTSLPRLFVEGNLGPHRPDPAMDEWAIVGLNFDGAIAPQIYRAPGPFPAPAITVWDADDLVEIVLGRAGATAPSRDSVDERILSEVRAGGGSIIDTPSQAGGYPALDRGLPPGDGDHDGMSDEWEVDHGLDPADPSDGNLDRDGDGYTNIEEFLFSLLP